MGACGAKPPEVALKEDVQGTNAAVGTATSPPPMEPPPTLSWGEPFERDKTVQNPLPACLHETVLTTVGKTPVVKLQRLVPNDGKTGATNRGGDGICDVYVKCEAFNPMGSIKDRLAVGIIEWAEHNGQIKPGQTVVEASSGNTGIGLAMVCAVKGYPFVCVMAESFSIERRKLMRFLGAKVILTNAAHKASGMVIKARELAAKHGWFRPCQFEHEANAWIHSKTTGPEILEAMEGKDLDYFFTSYGTGGTLKGVAEVLRERSPKTKIYVCEPDNAPLLYSGVPTAYNDVDGSFKEPHPVWRPHLLQGWTTDFIPKLVADAVHRQLFDKLVHVGGDKAQATSKALAQKEGIFTGTSGGGCLTCALDLAEELNRKAASDKKSSSQRVSILAMLPDTGERYISTPLFDGIGADMTEEEKALADSTPSMPPPPITLPDATEEALQFVRQNNSQHKVVIWSLEYCEFCWSIVKFFNTIGVPFELLNIDAFKYAKDNMGNKYRAAVQSITDCRTFPQCFINEVYIGGAADACIKWKKGELQPILESAGLTNEKSENYNGDPFEFLPKWMTQNPLRSN